MKLNYIIRNVRVREIQRINKNTKEIVNYFLVNTSVRNVRTLRNVRD